MRDPFENSWKFFNFATMDAYAANIAKIMERNKFKTELEAKDYLRKMGKMLAGLHKAYLKTKKFAGKPTISKDLLFWALNDGKLSELRLYLYLKFEKSGKFHKNDLPKIAKALKIKQSTLKKTISCAKSNYLLEQRTNGWYNIIGIKRWNIANGIMYPNLCIVEPGAYKTISILRSFCRTAQINMAAKKAENSQRVNGCISEQGVPVSTSYIANYADTSERTIFRHKKVAKKKGWVKFKENLKILEKGTKDDIARWRENKTSHKMVIRRIGPNWCLCEQLPSLVVLDNPFKKKKINYSKSEKDQIKAKFVKKDLIPAKRTSVFNQSIQIASGRSQEIDNHPFLV
jgi:hypothetical protein